MISLYDLWKQITVLEDKSEKNFDLIVSELRQNGREYLLREANLLSCCCSTANILVRTIKRRDSEHDTWRFSYLTTITDHKDICDD